MQKKGKGRQERMINRFKVLILTVLFLSFANLAMADENTNKDLKLVDRIVLLVNGEPVLQSEVEFAKTWFKTNDTKEAVNQLIDLMLISQQAKRLGIIVTNREVQEAIKRIIQANKMKNQKEFKEYLTQQGIAYSEFKNFVKMELLKSKFIQLYLTPKLLKGIKEGKLEKVRTVRIIFLDKLKPNYYDRLRTLKKVLNKNNFAEMAKKFSDDEFTKEEGGLLGNVKKGDLVKLLDDVVWKHKVSELFELPTDKGTYFIYIEKEKEIMVPSSKLDKAFLKKLEKEYKMYVKKLRQNAYIEYLDKSLR